MQHMMKHAIKESTVRRLGERQMYDPVSASGYLDISSLINSGEQGIVGRVIPPGVPSNEARVKDLCPSGFHIPMTKCPPLPHLLEMSLPAHIQLGRKDG